MSLCNICGSNKSSLLLNAKEFSVLKCDWCSIIYANPIPDDEKLAKFYQGFLFRKPNRKKLRSNIEKKKKELISLFNLAENNNKGKKFLDYGAGTGVSYASSIALGFDSYYQDLDNQAKQYAIENLGLKKEQIIDTLNGKNKKFSYIITDNVIEHVPDPISFTKDLVNVLEVEGVLIIKTPNAMNSEVLLIPLIIIRYVKLAIKSNGLMKGFKAFFSRYWHCDPPRHLYSFSKKSMQALIENLKIENISSEVFYYKLPAFDNTIIKEYFSPDKNKSLVKSIFLRIVLFPYIIVEFLLVALRMLLLKIGILSSGGIYLKIIKKA